MPAVYQVLTTLDYGDAIGNEVLGIRAVLREAGYTSEIFVETADPRLEPLTHDYRDLIDASHPDNILIHHYSIASKASRVAYALPDRMVLVYHNITPHGYFVGVHDYLAWLCYSGRRELRAYVNRCDLALGDSEFNRQELEQCGFPRTGVLPVVPSFAHLDETPDRTLVSEFDDERINILFVGRVIPSKRIEDLIRFYQAYRLKYQPNARLLLVGACDGFEWYLTSLHHLVATLRVPDVHIFGHVSNAELTACYDVADLFLSASEHEGFCVPLVEAFRKRIPVVAYAAAAVPATMDGAGVLYETKDPRYVAAIMDTVLSNPALESEIVLDQAAALDRLLARDFAGAQLGAIDQVTRAPRRPRPEVAWDFWQQFAELERLDELRLHRPAAYMALPVVPKERGETPEQAGDE